MIDMQLTISTFYVSTSQFLKLNYISLSFNIEREDLIIWVTSSVMIIYLYLMMFMFFQLVLLQVALLKFTGYKLLNNISDTGKAFLIILITDIFLG